MLTNTLPALAGPAPSGGEGTVEGAGEALGRSHGGFSTKLHLCAEGGGKPTTAVLTAGERHEQFALDGLMDKGAVPRSGRGRPRQTHVMRVLEIWMAIPKAGPSELNEFEVETDNHAATVIRAEAKERSESTELRLVTLLVADARGRTMAPYADLIVQVRRRGRGD